MKKIESINNEHIKALYKLKTKKNRDESQMFLVDGYHLVKEAQQYLKEVLIVDEKDAISGVENILVTMEIIKKLSSTETPQPIIGVCHYFKEEIEAVNRVLLLDNLQDPGNVGTLIRSALGFNMDLIVLSNDSVDIYNDKVIRASQGAIFKIKIIRKDICEMIEILKDKGIKVWGTSLKNGKALNDFEKVNKYALVLGNEGNGVKEAILNKCDKCIFVEMEKKLESLNVGIAGSIIMHYFYSK